jgi:transposase-like protein
MSMKSEKGIPAGAPVSPVEGGRSPTGTGETGGEFKRFFAKHKMQAVLRLLRGEPLELLSRDLGVTASTLSAWREIFLAAGRQGFKKKTPAQEAEAKRLNAKIGEQAMEIELLRDKITRMEEKNPLALRRSRL